MSTEYEDVLTNQPVVIDNVRTGRKPRFSTRTPSNDHAHSVYPSLFYIGLWNHQGRIRRPGSSKMLFPLIVRLTRSPALSGPRVREGWSIHTAPRFFLLSLSVGRPKHVRVMAGALEGDVFIGRKAQEFRGLLKIKYPMEHGIVTDWDDMERIWNWVYAEELGTLSEEVRTMLGVRGAAPRIDRLACSTRVVLRMICSAPGAADRGAIKSSNEPRIGGANILRHFQCPRSLHIRTSRVIPVRHNLALVHLSSLF